MSNKLVAPTMNKYPGDGNPLREQGGSVVNTLPKAVANELDVQPGDVPSVSYSEDGVIQLDFRDE